MDPPDADALDASDLLGFLGLVETHLEEDVVLVAAGGTALTLLGVKESTVDIDLTGPVASVAAFEVALAKQPHGYRVDTWPDGTVFMVTLPEDYLERSRPVPTDLEAIELRALDPVDVIVTKVARYDARDREDIRAAWEAFSVAPADVEARAAQAVYAGGEAAYEANLQAALGDLR